MPLRRIPALLAVENRKQNAFGRWPARDDPNSVNRVEPLCQPAFNPSFRLDYADKIYTVGSCFARNIEKALLARGFDVVSARFPNDDPIFVKHGTSLLNNYGVASILNEFRWALDPAHPFDPENNVFEIAPGRFVDLHLMPSVRALPREAVLARRERIISVTKRIVDCRIVILTLGMSELWFDSYSKTYLNHAVPHAAIAKFPDRYELHVLSYEETIACLREVVAILKRFCCPDQRILLSVSPVPLSATHTDRDVIAANSYSKSALRVAAEAIEVENNHIDYFPSFESVMLSERSRAWKDDQVHVQDDIITLNVTRMIGAYAPHALTGIDQGEISRRMQAALREVARDDVPAAIRHLEPIKDHLHQDSDATELYATLCLHLGRPGEALAALAAAPAKTGDWKRAMIDADILHKMDDLDGAIAAYLTLADQEPKRTAPLQRLTEIYHRLGQWDKGIAIARRWLRAAPSSGDAIHAVARFYRSMGDKAQADIAYRAAIELRPFYHPYLVEYVEFLIDGERVAEAAPILRRILPTTLAELQKVETLRLFVPVGLAGDLDPHTGQDDPLLANEIDRKARIADARAANEVAQRAAADLAAAKRHLREGEIDAALTLAAPLRDNERYAEGALQILAPAYLRNNQFAEAETAYRAWTDRRPDVATAFGGLARALTGQNRDAEAITALERALSLSPESLAWSRQLAVLLFGAGAFDRALHVIAQGLLSHPGDSRLLGLRQRIELITGKTAINAGE